MPETMQRAQVVAIPTGRNEPCPCRSGKKYKHCCLGRAAASSSSHSVTALIGEAREANRQAQGPSAEEELRLGTSLARKGRWKDAAASLGRSLQLRPNSAEAVNTLGVCLAHLGSHPRAIVCYQQAIALLPALASAHSNLGSSLSALDRHTEAIASLQRATSLDPSFADAFVNLGAALRSVFRLEESIAASLRAQELRPGETEALLNLGNAYKDRGELTAAAEAYRNAINSAPHDPRGYANLAETLRDHGRPAEAAAFYRRALGLQHAFATAYSNLLYLHAFTRDVTPVQELAEARGWEQAMLTPEEREAARVAAPREAGIFAAISPEGRQLRLGIVSAELGLHAVAEFLQPLLENLDRGRFHLTLFSTAGRTGARSVHLQSLADDFVSLCGVSDADAVALIRGRGIDVLMDTSGHTAANRLGIFARRAAPVQCTYIGYWSTTGLTEMDWFLSDPAAPANAEAGFSEGLWHLPRIAVSYAGDPSLPHDRWTPDPTGEIWLGSFNKFAKIREETLSLWAAVLHALPEGTLLLEDRGTHEEDSHCRIRTGLAAHGITPDRVEFIPYEPGHERHMLLYNRLDIALDTIPFNSGTTAFDALWMGVPLVTLEGDTIGGCMGASVLRTLGRPEWIAGNEQQYAAAVVTLARDVALRKHLRMTQRARMAASELCDAPGLTQALQESFLSMYRHWLRA